MPKLLRLREVRDRQALSQLELAQATGIAQATISRLERGIDSAQPRTLRKLAQALKVKPAELIEEQGASTHPLPRAVHDRVQAILHREARRMLDEQLARPIDELET